MDGLEAEAAKMTFRIGGDRQTAVVTVRGELDISNVHELEAAVASTIAATPDRLVVDVRDVRFADSSAIAVWVRWAAAVEELELRDPPPLLRQVITKMGLAATLRVTG
jgi:anti-anti-sigma factor